MPHLVLGTWTFSKVAVEAASLCLRGNQSCLDAVETAINKIEEDETYGSCVVGIGGARNSAGQLELDAAIMDGKSLQFGAVTALQGVPHAVSVARAVMEKCSHNMLTGSGATLFAKEQGFQIHESLLSPKVKQVEEKPEMATATGHDTLGLIVLDGRGNICTGVSTSGIGNKHPGRVGDSALPGGGLYADAESGAACCSGDGDDILRFCPSFLAVQLMKEGRTPQEACEDVICNIRRKSANKNFEVAIMAANMKNEYGAASTIESWHDPRTGEVFPGFPFVVWIDAMSGPEIRLSKTVTKT